MEITADTYLGLDGTRLIGERCQLFVQNRGGMTPEFSYRIDAAMPFWLNTHWLPHFRTQQYAGSELGDCPHKETGLKGACPQKKFNIEGYYGQSLLKHMGGSFACAPAFCSGNEQIPSHGDTANHNWTVLNTKQWESGDEKYIALESYLEGDYRNLQYRKLDYLRSNENAHYLVLEVTNPTADFASINLAWHGTLGAPFLERGCWLLDNCDNYQVAGIGSGYEALNQLSTGAKFSNLSNAPTKNGDGIDLSKAGGFDGQSLFVSATSKSPTQLWAAVYNPYYNLVYLNLIPISALPQQVAPSMMNYWFSRGGARFTPWADYDAGIDRCYALGLEASISGGAMGYKWSEQNPRFMDKPTMAKVPPNGSIAYACINSLFQPNLDDCEVLTEGYLRQQISAHINKLDIDFAGFTHYQSLSK